MRRISYSAVLGLLFLQLAYGTKSVFDAGHHWEYEYNSNIITKNAASDEHIAEWNVSGKLKIQSAKDQIVIKLDDLKTSVFNGVRSNRQDAVDHNIPAEAQVLSEPFVVHYTNDDDSHKDIQISHQPNEPLWSVNMKRAIASIFQMKDNQQVDKEHKTHESTIYGNCQVAYKVETFEDKQIVDKIFDYETCKEVRDISWSNVKSYGAHSAIKGEMERVYHYTKKDGQFVIGDVESSANFTYRNMPDVQTSQHILQKQIFKLLEQTKIVDAIDTSKSTEKTTVLFEHPDDTDGTFGRNTEKKKSQLELIEEFVPAFEEFRKQHEKSSVLNFDIRENDTIEHMYDILSELDKDSLASLNQRVFTDDNEDNTLMQQVFLAILPYVGEDSTISLIKDLAKNDQVNNALLVQLLATFPIYSTPSVELVKEMEILMDIPFKSTTTRNTALLSFASLVAYNHEKGTVSDEMMTKYQEKFMHLYKGTNIYGEQFAYLLCLINLANGDDKLMLNYIMPIACDTNELKHLRALAMHAFAKLSFSETKVGQLYETFWPMVGNQSEPFEIRIAALEMILSNLPLITKEHFNTIINSYTEYQTDPQDRHIQNYIYTKHITLLDEPYYKEFITDATAIKIKAMKKNKSVAAWTTGNYYMGYTDEANNFGNSLETKFVANPISNAVNVAEVTYRSHAMSLDLGTYTIYLKYYGANEKFFGKYFLDSRDNGYEPVLELLEMITKNGYALKDPDINIELAVFANNRAIVAVYIDDTSRRITGPIIDDIRKLSVSYASISWPVAKVSLLVSDLGTPIEIENELLIVTSHNISKIDEDSNDIFTSLDLKHRRLWRNSMTLKSYNPIADMTITTYKLINKEKKINFPFHIYNKKYQLSWKPEADSLTMVSDDLIGTYADEEMEHYCANCHTYNELPMEEVEPIYAQFFPIEVATGTKLNLTRTKNIDDHKSGVSDIFNLHRANSATFLLAKPILYFWHYVNYCTWINGNRKTIDRVSLRSLPYFSEPTESTIEFNITENIYYDNDPFEKVQFDISLALTNRKVADGTQLGFFNASYQFVSKSKTSEDNTKAHIVDRHFAQMETTANETYKMCFDREISYPDRRANKYSITPIEPAKGKTSISWGVQKKDSDTCATEKYIKISEIFSATDEHNQKVRDTKDYKTCKHESKNRKYTPPTDACLAVFEMMSEYDLYKFYGDFRHAGRLGQAVSILEHTNYGIKLLEVERDLDGSVNFTYSKDFVKLFIDVDKHNIVSRESVSDFLKYFDVNPSDESYDDHVIKYGISNNCFITPSNIKTFNGKSIANYEADYGKEFVALIECTNNTRAGVTVQRLNDKKIGFTLISDGNEIVATVVDDKLKVTFNGTDMERKNKYDVEDISRTYFLDDNTIYVVDNILELFYNTEYLIIKTFSMYSSYTCGACTYQKQY